MRAIAEQLGVSVSSVSLWTRGIDLSGNQRAEISAAAAVRRSESNRRCWRERRMAYQEQGREMARRGDPLHAAGCMLFWGEGSKMRNQVRLANSDVGLMQLFLRFLRTCYGVTDDCVRFSVNCFLGNGLALDQIEKWWLAQLVLPPACLRTAQVNRISRASARKRPPLVYGTGHLVVNSTPIVQSIYGAIQEYAGIERPEWLG